MDKLVPFETKARLLRRAAESLRTCASSPEQLEKAVPLLLRAMKHADERLKKKIIAILGPEAGEEAAWALYRLLSDPSQGKNLRSLAAGRLRAFGPSLEESHPLLERLYADMRGTDADLRRFATRALGWEGNTVAALHLLERLYDRDARVRQEAVDALVALRDPRVPQMLLERLKFSPVVQKRVILRNLMRFISSHEDALNLYLLYAESDNPDVRLEALLLLETISEPARHLLLYKRRLRDPDPRIRKLALQKVARALHSRPVELELEAAPMLTDPDPSIRALATRILEKGKG